jgi:DNA-directed RNA polymerase subunit RPC12/RpoP
MSNELEINSIIPRIPGVVYYALTCMVCRRILGYTSNSKDTVHRCPDCTSQAEESQAREKTEKQIEEERETEKERSRREFVDRLMQQAREGAPDPYPSDSVLK